jgi:hypothetical protein
MVSADSPLKTSNSYYNINAQLRVTIVSYEFVTFCFILPDNTHSFSCEILMENWKLNLDTT